MITTFLVQYPWVSPTLLALMLVVGALAGRWLAPRPRQAALLCVLSLVPVVALILSGELDKPWLRRVPDDELIVARAATGVIRA